MSNHGVVLALAYARGVDPNSPLGILAAEVERLTAERDRARATAVALEQELAQADHHGRCECDYCGSGLVNSTRNQPDRCFVEDHASQIADLRGYLKDARESK